MSLHQTARWTVTYDIADARRGVRVHRFMCRHGVPLQYSVFLVEASSAEMQRLLADLKEHIAWSADDVRAYRWPAEAECHQLGTPLLPDDVLEGVAGIRSVLLG